MSNAAHKQARKHLDNAAKAVYRAEGRLDAVAIIERMETLKRQMQHKTVKEVR